MHLPHPQQLEKGSDDRSTLYRRHLSDRPKPQRGFTMTPGTSVPPGLDLDRLHKWLSNELPSVGGAITAQSVSYTHLTLPTKA